MTGSTPSRSEHLIAACCADFYASDVARWLLGDSFHPGGIELTERLGRLLGLNADSLVLDLASGQGTSAIHLAEQFGCRVVGLDLSGENTVRARSLAGQSLAADRIAFVTGDVREIPLSEATIDAIICECSFCTFPDKRGAATEMFRVLRPGGQLGLSDLTRHGSVPEDLNGLLGHVLCIADAQPVSGYRSTLETAGFQIEQSENHDQRLRTLVADVRSRLIGAKLFARAQNIGIPGVDIDQTLSIARSAARSVEDGTLGYSLLTARK